MDRTNAECQRRYIQRLKARAEADALTGTPAEIADNILRALQLSADPRRD